MNMTRFRLNRGDGLLGLGGILLWGALCLEVPQGTGWGGDPVRFVMTPLVLCGGTLLIFRLLGGVRHALPLAAVLAAGIVGVTLSLVAWLSG
jgi:hypothetical protein